MFSVLPRGHNLQLRMFTHVAAVQLHHRDFGVPKGLNRQRKMYRISTRAIYLKERCLKAGNSRAFRMSSTSTACQSQESCFEKDTIEPSACQKNL